MSLGALTTQFTPSPSCLESSNLWEVKTTLRAGNRTVAYQFFGLPSDRARNCFPSPSWNPTHTAYYSPARCPAGYTGASTGLKAIGSLTETTEVCCPSAMGFQYQTQPNPNINYPFLETLVCESKHGFTVITLTSSAAPDEEPFITTRTLQGGALNAYGIIVRYQSGDFDGPKNTSGGGRGGSGGSTTGGSETGGIQQTSSSGNGNASKDSSLSTGASIGIGAGLGILGLGMVIGAVVLVLKMRKKKERKEVETYGEMSAGHGGSYRYAHNGEVVSEMGHQNQDPVEIEGDFYSKIPGMGNAPAELDGAVRGGGGLKG